MNNRRAPRRYKKRSANKIPKKYIPKKQSEKSITKIVRKELRKNTEVKKIDYHWGLQNINHNNYNAVPLNKFQEKLVSFTLNTPTTGTGDSNIVGTRYKIIGMQLYIMFTTVNDRLNTKFRVMILRFPAGKSVSNYGDIFDNVTGATYSNILLDPVDKDNCTVLYDKITGLRNINTTNSTDNATWVKKIWVPKQKYKVQHEEVNSSSVKFPKFTDYLCIFAFDANGSLSTDTVGSVNVARRLYFVDDV